MRKLFFLSLIVLGTLASQAQTTNVVNTNTVPSSPTTPTAPVAPAAPAPTKNSEDSISHKIKLIDEKIALIYEKEKKTPLTEADFLRLDRLQEARMIAELRLQTGFGDTNRLNELLADEINVATNLNNAPSTPKTPSSEEIIQNTPLLPQSPSIPTNSPANLEEILHQVREDYQRENNLSSMDTNNIPSEQNSLIDLSTQQPISPSHVINSSLSNAASQTTSTLTDSQMEAQIGLREDQIESYRNTLTTFKTRIRELNQKIETSQKEINSLIDQEFPDYSLIFDHSRSIMDMVYESAITQVELRRELRIVLTEEQFKRWIQLNRHSQQLSPVVLNRFVSAPQIIPNSEDGSLIYVPMRLVPTQTQDGRTINIATPLKSTGNNLEELR